MPILITNGLGPTAAADRLRRKGATRPEGARFALEAADEAAPEAPAATPFVCPMALLQVQEAPAPAASQGRAAILRHGTDLLDRLADLRLSLVAGAVAPARLRALTEALAAGRQASDDPRLDALIGEIELRAAVELAKLRAAAGPGKAPARLISHSISKS